MSEREVREAAERVLSQANIIWHSEWGEKGSPRDQLEKALAQPPDLVALLRKLRAWQKQIVICNKTGSFLCPDTLLHVMEHIEETVRLTDDGWEWVEKDDAEAT